LNEPIQPARRRRLSAHELTMRRDRVFARMLEGQRYPEIAVAEAITLRQVREIIQEALAQEDVDPQSDFALVQIARLEGALRLIEKKIAEGELTAVDRLVKVLALLDRYHAQPMPFPLFEEREPGLSEAMMTRTDRAAASREAVALKPAPLTWQEEISLLTRDEDQTIDNSRFEDLSDASHEQESMT
jgi:hypothetical protein